MAFQKAERKQVPLKIALSGPSGSGKTFSALLIAKGIGGKIAVIDTEHGSASLYAGLTSGPLAGLEFDVDQIDPPYSTEKYIQKMHEAVRAGYTVLIIDSISHQWAGEGGILDKKALLDLSPKSNSFANWKKMTPEHEKFKAQILHSDIHLICTMRSKQDFQQVELENGKTKIQRVGMAPIQRDGMEYEFTAVFDLDVKHNAEVTKDRTGLFDGQIFQPSEETGKLFMAWLSGAKQVEKKPAPSVQPKQQARPQQPQQGKPSPAQLTRLHTIVNAVKLAKEDIHEVLRVMYGVESSKDLSLKQYEDLCNALESGQVHAWLEQQRKPAQQPQHTPPPEADEVIAQQAREELPWEKYLDDPRNVK